MREDGCEKTLSFPFLEPHRVFAYVHDVLQIHSPPDHVAFYWAWGKRFNYGWAQLGGPGAVPVGLYADEARYDEAGNKVLGVFANMVLHRPKSIRRSRFLLFALRSSFIRGTDTLHALYLKITESLHIAFRGCGESGTRYLLTELRGDLMFHKQLWGCRGGWVHTSEDSCFFCEAKARGDASTGLYYTDISLDAEWRKTEFKNVNDWAAKVLDKNKICP